MRPGIARRRRRSRASSASARGRRRAPRAREPPDAVTGVRVAAPRDRRARERFIAFPYALHSKDPGWAPPLRRDVRTLLSEAKNPFFAHAEAEHFLAERGGDVVGRITAIHNRAHNAFHGDRVGFFGFFE